MPFVNQYPEMCETLAQLSSNPAWRADEQPKVQCAVEEPKSYDKIDTLCSSYSARSTLANRMSKHEPEPPPLPEALKNNKSEFFTQWLVDAVKDGKIAALLTAEKTKTTKSLRMQEVQYECDHLAETIQQKLAEERKNLRRRRFENGGKLGTRRRQMLEEKDRASGKESVGLKRSNTRKNSPGSICIASKRKSSLYDFAENPKHGPAPGVVIGAPEDLIPLTDAGQEEDEEIQDVVGIASLKQWAVTRQAQKAGVISKSRPSMEERRSRLSLGGRGSLASTCPPSFALQQSNTEEVQVEEVEV